MSNQKNELALINPSDLSLVEENRLNPKQLALILKKTPKQYVKQRPAKGGGQWSYVTGGYVRKMLNLMFGFDWSFEILDEKIMYGEAIVKGKLTCNTGGRTIVKTQFGNKDIIFKRELDKDGNRVPLSIGNDLKSAATDALKKCAAEIGIAADIYNAEDFREVMVDTNPIEYTLENLEKLFNEKLEKLTPEDTEHIERIIENKEKESYRKVIDHLKKM